MRYLLCPKCDADGAFVLHPEDVRNGFKERRTKIPRCEMPPGLARTQTVRERGHVHVEKTVMQVMECDACGGKIPAGTEATAVTHWRSEEPGRWEVEYGAP